MDTLQRKLADLAQEAACRVDLAAAIDLAEPPQSARVSFPYPALTPPFEELSREGLARALGVDEAHLSPGVYGALVDVSSQAGGVCQVTASCFGRWHAHAGAHADQPAHWLAEPPFERFPDAFYRGAALALDLAPALAERAPRAIDRALLEGALARAGVAPEELRRLLFRTEATPGAAWDPNFAFLDPEAARWLGGLPRLVLLGTDAPSVDAADAAPIAACAHGGLFAGRVAILEGLRLDGVSFDAAGAARGALQVVWSPVQDHPDARGCAAVLWYPA